MDENTKQNNFSTPFTSVYLPGTVAVTQWVSDKLLQLCTTKYDWIIPAMIVLKQILCLSKTPK
jgi:hypothetical protein